MTLPADAPRFATRSIAQQKNNGNGQESLVDPIRAVDTVSNAIRGFGYHVEVVGVAYDSDLQEVRAAMQDAFTEVERSSSGSQILGPLDMHGVVQMGDSAVNVRARIKTRPGQQWAVGRAYTEAVKHALERRGIEIPFPHRELRLPQEFLASLRNAESKG